MTPSGPTSAAIDEKVARVGAYYMGNYHGLIHRHTESIDLRSDQTARWRLKIDLELPVADEARCGQHQDEALFLFPLLFLRKAEGRTGFEARDQQGARIPLPNRATSSYVSALAAARSAELLIKKARKRGRDLPELPRESLEFVFLCVATLRAYKASVVLNELLNKLDPEIAKVWYDAGLIDDLEMLVDHSLVWIPIRGLPGERKTIDVEHDIELSRRPLLRWHFGKLDAPRFPRLRWRRRRQRDDSEQVLDTGEAKYGRAAWRVSFSVLGERLAQPLAWMPIEFDFPTIYARRCGSYHFELNCPPGLSPYGVKVGLDTQEKGKTVPGRTKIGTRGAHVYLPDGRWLDDVMIRATVGIGAGAFPILWLLMGVVTTAILWSLVAFNPNWLVAGDTESHNEIAAGVLLIVPALLGAVIIGTEEKAVSSLISGVRILLLVIGLCCTAATAVLIRVEPFSTKPQATWAVCAAIATAAMIPLATSWLLSSRSVRQALKVMNTRWRQHIALYLLVSLAFLLMIQLGQTGGDTTLRGGLASCFLLLSVLFSLLASNRLAVELDTSRGFISVGALFAAVSCLILGCTELQAVFAPLAHWHVDVEDVEKWIILAAPLTGVTLGLITGIFGPRGRELSISPGIGEAVIAGERIRELRKLRELDEESGETRLLNFLKPARELFSKGGAEA